MKLQYKAFTKAGPKGDNQDALLPPFHVAADIWCGIADGVGSSKEGGLAARSSLQFVKSIDKSMSMKELFSNIRLNLHTIAHKHKIERSFSTTLTILNIVGGYAYVGHVGDTRITHYRGQGAMLRTRDQTEVQKLVDEGLISPNQAARYPRRNVLISAMSIDREFSLFESVFELNHKDRVILSSDGFHSVVLKREVSAVSAVNPSFDEFCVALEAFYSDRDFYDDASCLVIEVE